jgi:hypothetical protein
MRWTKINDHWECVFVNVPFKVLLVDKVEFIKATLLFTEKDFWVKEISTKTYASIELAKSEVEQFILEHLAMYSAQVHQECLEANVMTWRKLKQQLDEIPEDQLDEEIKVLDTGYDWCGTPAIVKAIDDQLQNDDNGHDVTEEDIGFCNHSVVVEKGHYYLHTEL